MRVSVSATVVPTDMSGKDKIAALYDEPAYGVSEAAAYLKVPYNTLRYWLTGFKRMPPVVASAQVEPLRLSFLNLLECHALAGMRKLYNLQLPKVRSALVQLSGFSGSC
jgi:hypothetical protein